MYEAQNAYQRLSFSLDRNSVDAAIMEIKTFLKIFPDVALAHNDLGVLMHKAGNSLLALAHYEKANRLQSGNPIIIKNIAEFYFAVLGWTDDAIGMLTELLADHPNDFELLTSLGNISNQLGRLEESKTFYKKAYEINPDNIELREILANLNGPVSAAEYRLAPASPLPSAVPKTAPELVKQEDDALSQLERMLTQNPDNALAHNNIAVALFQQGQLTEAAGHYERAATLEPTNAIFRKNLADLYYSALDRTDEAIEIYTTILKKMPKDIEALTALAIISKSNHLTEQAKTFIKKVIDIEPWNSDAREFLATL
jgi:tetratricopeptide (TPR) repeat protein